MAPTRISPRTATRAMQMVQRRQFNAMARIRQSVRSFEPHPFERLPTTIKPAPGDWGKQFKRVGDAALFFFPGFALVLGWPLIGEALLDGNMK